jgi:twitching motility protein PilT
MDRLFQWLVDHGGSDLHLTSGRRPMMRVHGDMMPMDVLPSLSEKEVRLLIWEIMPERNRQEYEQRNDTDFAYEVPGVARLRANVFRDRIGIGAVFRVIPTTIRTADELGLPKVIRDLCRLSKGFVVVTGPTGSGKSTTLAAMVDLINRTLSGHIITIEDPIEFVHAERRCHITQREVHAHTSSFAQALRAALREDPNIVLVGEMRDLETIEIAIETAETGHLVFGTLHTNTAASTVDRIIDVFPTNRQNQIRTMLSVSLKGVISQTLCRQKGGGRVAALEVLVVDSAIAALIRDGKTFQIPTAMQVARSRGMILMNESLADLVVHELVDPVEAYLRCVDKEDLLSRFKKAGIAFDHSKISDAE